MRELVDVMTFDPQFASDDLIHERADMTASRPQHNHHFLDGVDKRPVVELDLDRVPTIAAPTHLLHGRDDRVVHFENSLRLLSLIPDSRLAPTRPQPPANCRSKRPPAQRHTQGVDGRERPRRCPGPFPFTPSPPLCYVRILTGAPCR